MYVCLSPIDWKKAVVGRSWPTQFGPTRDDAIRAVAEVTASDVRMDAT